MCGSVDLSSFNKIIDRECIEAYATFKIKDKIPDLMPSMKAAKKLVLTEGAGDNCATEYIPPLQIQIQIQIFFFFSLLFQACVDELYFLSPSYLTKKAVDLLKAAGTKLR